MGLFDDLEQQAKELYDAKRNEIGKYVGDFFGQALNNAKSPVEQSAPATPVTQVVQAATPYMKYAIPAVALLGLALLFRNKGGKK